MSKHQRQVARQVALSMPRKNGRFVKRKEDHQMMHDYYCQFEDVVCHCDDEPMPDIEYRIEEKLDLLLLNMQSVKQRLEELEDIIRIK